MKSVMTKYECDVSVCPYCGNVEKNRVHASARTKEGYFVRVRECAECLGQWRTYEVHAEEFKKAKWALMGLRKLVEKYGGEEKEG